MNPSFEHTFQETFRAITDPTNIRAAYLDLARKFDIESKSMRYRGVDGIKMSSLDFDSKRILEDIRQEMLALKKPSPAYLATIPKKNGKKRKIYVYPVKERIKAEAIYRILMPLFDAYFSAFLFSYRSSHPSYYAARSAVRRYKRHFGEDHVLVTDISDYADTIDHDILLSKLARLGLDAGTLELLKLFIKTDTIEEGALTVRPRGVLTGTPLYALLANFYMDDFDKWAGKRVAFYRRVGDDIIAMDKDAAKITCISERLSETVEELKLHLNKDKARLIANTETFSFLGYTFKEGKIGFDTSSKNKAIASWKSRSVKLRNMRDLHTEFKQLIEQKILVDDTAQVKAMSERFFSILTAHLKGKSSAKNRRLVTPLLKKAGAPSLFEYYLKARYPTTHASRNGSKK